MTKLLSGLTFAIIASLLLLGCDRAFYKKSANGSSAIIKTPQFDTGGTLLFSFYDATKRSSVTFITPNGQLRTLAENNPDAATNRAFDLISKLSLSHAGKDSLVASNQLSIAKTIVQLTQKSPTDIFVRDALYRLNEMYLNTLCLDCDSLCRKKDPCDTCCSQKLTRVQYERIFSGVLKSAEVISATDANAMEQQIKRLELQQKFDSTNDLLEAASDKIKKLSDSLSTQKKTTDSLNKKAKT
jgi:hypothetical protein